MSVYSVATTDKGIFNLPREVEGFDVSTRNPYNATIIGYGAGEVNQGNLNTMLGYRAGQTTRFGSCNTFIGAQAAEKNVNGTDNLIAGTLAARFLTTGSRNVVLGNNSGSYLNGNNNIFIGFNNTVANVFPLSYCNVSIGYGGNMFGNNNIAFGNNSYIFANSGIALGNSINDVTDNSILFGANIINKGSNVLIINNRHNSNVPPQSLSNAEHDYMNINDYIVASKNAEGEHVLRMTDDVIEMVSARLAISLFGANVELGEVMKLVGKYSGLELNQSVTLGLNTVTNPNAPQLYMTSNFVGLGGCNVNALYLQGSNTSLRLNSNVISLSNNFAEVAIDSTRLRIGGSNVNNFQVYGSNVTFQLNSNVVSLSNMFAEASINSNNVFFGGSNVDNMRIYTSNSRLTMNSNVYNFSNNYVESSFNSNNVIIGGIRVADLSVYGFHTRFAMNSNVFALSNDFWELSVDSNALRLGGSNVNDIKVYGSNVFFTMNSNVVALSNTYVETYFDETSIRFGAANNQVTTIYGSNNVVTMSNGGVYMDSMLVVYRDTILSNNLTVNKQSVFKDNVDIYDDVVAYSNATFEQDLYINSNSVIYVNSNVSFCNDNRMFIRGQGETQVLQPLMTKCNVYVESKMSFCNMQVRYVNWDNVNEQELQELYGSTIVQKNLFVGGMMYAPGVNVSDRLVMLSGNGANQWSQYVAVTSNANPYLVFQSGTGTTIKLGDDFTPELFNFTGKHRCHANVNYRNDDNDIKESLLGKIVIAVGNYKNLNNDQTISIDEAIPVIELASTKLDSRAFGVISAFETQDDKRVFRLGNLHFETEKDKNDIKVIVNSVGEGGIWVCNENGNLHNGDLIVTASIEGYGMRQDDDIVRSYTVAKITCDCAFDCNDTMGTNDSIWTPEIKTMLKDGREYKTAFVGCTYKF